MAKPIGGDNNYNDYQMPPFHPGRGCNISDEEWAKAVGGDQTMDERNGWEQSDVSGQRFKKRYNI